MRRLILWIAIALACFVLGRAAYPVYKEYKVKQIQGAVRPL